MATMKSIKTGTIVTLVVLFVVSILSLPGSCMRMEQDYSRFARGLDQCRNTAARAETSHELIETLGRWMESYDTLKVNELCNPQREQIQSILQEALTLRQTENSLSYPEARKGLAKLRFQLERQPDIAWEAFKAKYTFSEVLLCLSKTALMSLLFLAGVIVFLALAFAAAGSIPPSAYPPTYSSSYPPHYPPSYPHSPPFGGSGIYRPPYYPPFYNGPPGGRPY